MKPLAYLGILFGLVVVSGMVRAQNFTPLTFELSGIVEEISSDHSQIVIDGQRFNLGGGVVVHNLVNSDPVAPLKVGSEVGYTTDRLSGGVIEIVELWVLASP